MWERTGVATLIFKLIVVSGYLHVRAAFPSGNITQSLISRLAVLQCRSGHSGIDKRFLVAAEKPTPLRVTFGAYPNYYTVYTINSISCAAQDVSFCRPSSQIKAIYNLLKFT